MADAERQARAFFERLGPWGASSTPTIEWKSVAAPPPEPATFGGPFELTSAAVLEALEQEGMTREQVAPVDKRLDYIVDRLLRLDHGWRIAAERHLEVLPATWPPSTVRGRDFAELLNPFEPILQIWQLGYLLEADDQAALLMAPIATLV